MSRLRRHRLLAAGIVFSAASVLAQEAGIDDEDERFPSGWFEEDIPDVEIPDVRIDDVEIPDVLIGEQDRVVDDEPPPPPPVAVFDEAEAEAEAAVEEEETQPAARLEPTPLVGEEMGGTAVTGDVRAIDLETGRLEVESDTQGIVVLSIDRARLRQLAPGQSVSLTYVDRDDGRWVSELETLRPAAPAASPTAP